MSQSGYSPSMVHIRVRPRLLALACLLLTLFLGVTGRPGLLASAETPIEELYLTILHTNDEHSSLIPHSPAIDYVAAQPQDPTVGGMARLGGAIAGVRSAKAAEGEPVLLLSGGDFMGETPFGWLVPTHYAAEMDLMHALGYDAVTIGNHEFDYGPDVLADYLLAAGYPAAHDRTVVLASNTIPSMGHPVAQEDLFRKTAVFDLENGLRVGVFGLLGAEAASLTSDTGDFVFLDQHETAREMVAELRRQQVDIVIALSHAGLAEDRELARAVPGIHLIVGGHCHSALHEPVIEGSTIIVQAGSSSRYLGRIELAYSALGRLRIRNSELGHAYLIPMDASVAPDPVIALLVDEYRDRLNALLEEMTGGRFDDVMAVLARSEFDLPYRPPLQESPAGNLIADAMRIISQEVLGKRVDVAVQANGSIRGAIIRGTMPHARDGISFYDLTSVIGLGYGPDGYAGYPIVSVYLTGEELRRVLEVAVLLQDFRGDDFFLQYSGLRYRYNPRNAVLLTVPILDQPLPTGRAATRAEIYTGEGMQPVGQDPGYAPLKRGDDALYHLVTDSYILSFLPMVGELVPHLGIEPKDAEGNVVGLEELDRLIVHWPDGRELKVWQTVAEYVAMQPAGPDGAPQIPAYYAQTGERITPVQSFPLIALVYALLLLPGAAVAAIIVRHKRRR